MQSCVLWALMQEILANELTAARGSTAISALDSSAHFLCSRSESVHHRNFFPVGWKKKSTFVEFGKKKISLRPYGRGRLSYFILFKFTRNLILLTHTHISTHLQAPNGWAQALPPRSLLPNMEDKRLSFLLNLYSASLIPLDWQQWTSF